MSDRNSPADQAPDVADGCPFSRSAATLVPDHVPSALVRHYDCIADPRISHDLWQLAADMADEPEIFWTTAQGGYWVVTSAAALEAIADRPELFSRRVGRIPVPENKPTFIPSSVDPPEHTHFRKEMTRKLFSVRALVDLENDVANVCAAAIGEFAADRQADFVSAFAKRMPADLFLTLMGADPSNWQHFLEWVERVFRPQDPEDLAKGFAQAAAFTSQRLDEQ